MSYLDLLRHSVTSFLTPKKEKQESQHRQRVDRDRKLMPPPPLSRPLRLDDREMTPTTKTTQWLSEHLPSLLPPEYSPNPPKNPKVLRPNTDGTKIAKKYRSKASRLDSPERDFNPDDEYDSEEDFEGPTLVADQGASSRKSSVYGSTTKNKKAQNPSRIWQPSDDESEEDTTETSNKKPAKLRRDSNELLAAHAFERARRAAEIARLPEGQHWSKTEQELFSRLSLRGFEPLIPSNWRIDFNTFPDPLFAGKDEEPIFKPKYGSDFRAINALQALIRLGPIARDRIICSQSPERILHKTIRRFNRWVFTDALLSKYPSTGIPVHVIVSHKPYHSKAETVSRLHEKLHGLADEWRELSSVRNSVEDVSYKNGQLPTPPVTPEDFELPILTGVLIVHSLVAIVTLDPNDELSHGPASGQGNVRQLILIDMGHAAYDVWNAFALAIVGIHLRNVRMALDGRLAVR